MLSRRTALGVLAAAPMAASELFATSGDVRADTHFDQSRFNRPPRHVPWRGPLRAKFFSRKKLTGDVHEDAKRVYES
jgi:hypothetical protein